MKKIAKVEATNARERRPIGRDLEMSLLTPPLRHATLKRAERQADKPSLPEAVLRLVALGWTVAQHRKQPIQARARTANEIAAVQLDKLADASASSDEQADRKSQLLKGPEKFRNARIDNGRRS